MAPLPLGRVLATPGAINLLPDHEAKDRDVGFQSFEVGGHRIWAEEDVRRRASVA